MIVSISSELFDLSGQVTINTLANNTNGETNRRVNRVATLDGGSAISDRGYSESDRDLVYSWRPESKAQNDLVDRMVKLHARVHVATVDGVYLANFRGFTPGVNESSLRLYVIDKLT